MLIINPSPHKTDDLRASSGRQQPNPEILRSARTERQAEELGDYYTIERKALSSGVRRTSVKLEKLGRELGVLRPWEELEAETKTGRSS
jgi:broad specificity phosphatase PhoE